MLLHVFARMMLRPWEVYSIPRKLACSWVPLRLLLISMLLARSLASQSRKVQIPVSSSIVILTYLLLIISDRPVGLDYVSAEEQAELDSIKKEKEVIQGDIEGIQNQQKLLKMVHERSIVAVNHPSLDVKDICGYDNRLAMNDAEFARWMKTDEGKKAFKTGVLGQRTAETKSIGAVIPYPGQATPAAADVPEALDNICLKGRKKCRHSGWREVHNQDFIFTQTQLRDKLKKLQEKEDEIIDDAETREATKEYYADNITEQLF